MKWTKGMDMSSRVGQTVYAWGLEGKVVKISNDYYSTHVDFKNGLIDRFMLDGRFNESHEAPSLFHTPQTYEIELPKYEPKEGEVVWVREIDKQSWEVKVCKTVSTNKITLSDVGSPFSYLHERSMIEIKPFKGELP